MTATSNSTTDRDGAMAASALAAQTTLSSDLAGTLTRGDLCRIFKANPQVLEAGRGPHTLGNPWGGPSFSLITCSDDGCWMLALGEVTNV